MPKRYSDLPSRPDIRHGHLGAHRELQQPLYTLGELCVADSEPCSCLALYDCWSSKAGASTAGPEDLDRSYDFWTPR